MILILRKSETVIKKMGVEQPPPHKTVNIVCIVCSVATFILTTAFNALAGSGAGVPDVFYSTVGDISDKYELYITPAGTYRL